MLFLLSRQIGEVLLVFTSLNFTCDLNNDDTNFMKMSSQYSIGIKKHGKDYGITIPEVLADQLNLKERSKADAAFNVDVICISLSDNSDLILLTHRWENLLNAALKQYCDLMIEPKKFAPAFKFIMFNIFKFIESIYFDYYGPDYLIRNFYYQSLAPLNVDDTDTEEIKMIKEQLPAQFLKLTKKQNINDMSLKDRKSIMDYLESKKFRELLLN